MTNSVEPPPGWDTSVTADMRVPSAAIDTSVAHPARRYDYWLGGKDNFEADRASGDAVAEMFPTIRTAIIENRRFLGRAVHFLAAEAGISQFLDIGTGIPAANNTHEVAQDANPAARVVYVDNDPIVLAHARALLTSTHAEGTTAYIDADLREPEGILSNPALKVLDFSQPVALMLVAVLHFVSDTNRAYDVVRTLVGALPKGSYLVISHATNDYIPPDVRAEIAKSTASREGGFCFRSRDEFAEFFTGLDLVPPGIVATTDWRPDGEIADRPSAADVAAYAAVGRIR